MDHKPHVRLVDTLGGGEGGGRRRECGKREEGGGKGVINCSRKLLEVEGERRAEKKETSIFIVDISRRLKLQQKGWDDREGCRSLAMKLPLTQSCGSPKLGTHSFNPASGTQVALNPEP